MPDINNDGHRRLECGDVGKVLFGANAKVNTTLLCRFQEVRNYVLKAGFVGQQVVRTEDSILLRPVSGQIPELPVAEFAGGWRGRTPGRDEVNSVDDDENQPGYDED